MIEMTHGFVGEAKVDKDGKLSFVANILTLRILFRSGADTHPDISPA